MSGTSAPAVAVITPREFALGMGRGISTGLRTASSGAERKCTAGQP